jgi:hypothetical protein
MHPVSATTTGNDAEGSVGDLFELRQRVPNAAV